MWSCFYAYGSTQAASLHCDEVQVCMVLSHPALALAELFTCCRKREYARMTRGLLG